MSARKIGDCEKRFGKFIQNARAKYGNKFDYSLVKYIDNHTKINIVCPVHGVFKQRPNNHLLCKEGCYQCGKNRAGKNHRLTTGEFIVRCKKAHNGYYNYDKVNYIGSFLPVIITCPNHGDFTQQPNDHMFHLTGCVKCGYENRMTRGERRIANFLLEHNIVFEIQKQFPELIGNKGDPLRFDFYLTDKKILIEFDGPHHIKPVRYKGKSIIKAKITHDLTYQYDLIKNKFAQEKGMQLIRIPYSLLKQIKEILTNQLLTVHALRPTSNP